MKIVKFPKEKSARIAYIALLSIAALLVVLLLTGTIIGLTRQNKTEPLIKFESAPKKTITSEDDIRVFSGLGRLRIPLSNSSILLLSIAFPYSASDSAFTEELAAKIGDFRTAASTYFSSLPAESITYIDEETAKQEILHMFNESLRLGRINALYFSDMMVIDAGL